MDMTRLSVGDSGSHVARLHEKLRASGLTVPGDEIRRMFFGPVTRDAVLQYQAEHGLTSTGIIDVPTAESLDKESQGGGESSVTAEQTVGELRVTWSPLSTRITSLPLVICGPILRRTERQRVSVWIAFQRSASGIELKVYDTPNPPAGATPALVGPPATAIQLGDRLFVALVTADQPTNPGAFLVPGRIYGYDVTLGSESDATLATPGILSAPASAAGGIDRITYGSFALPSFVLPAEDVAGLQLVHGSCRKPHGGRTDALRALDSLLTERHADPGLRPQQLFQTGDQIYADDVADPLLHMVVDAQDTLLGWSEPLPGNPPAAALAVGERQATTTAAGLSSDEAKSHLIRLGEYYSMYLLAWSDVLWPAPADLPDFAVVHPGLPQVEPVVSDTMGRSARVTGTVRTTRYSNFVSELVRITEFQRSLPFARKALANIPSYMVFDDHEVTDDWFLTGGWCARALQAGGLARRVIQNALSAFAVFQAWGNGFPDFAPGGRGRRSCSGWCRSTPTGARSRPTGRASATRSCPTSRTRHPAGSGWSAAPAGTTRSTSIAIDLSRWIRVPVEVLAGGAANRA